MTPLVAPGRLSHDGVRGVTRFQSVFACGLAGALTVAGAQSACTTFGSEDGTVDGAAARPEGTPPPLPVEASPDAVAVDGGPGVSCVVAFDTRFADSGTSGWATYQRGPALRLEAGSDGLRVLGTFESDAAGRSDYFVLRRDVVLGPAGAKMRVAFGPIQGALASAPFTAGLVGGLSNQNAGNATLQVRWTPPSTLSFLTTPGSKTVASFQGVDPSAKTTYEVTFLPDGTLSFSLPERPLQVVPGTGIGQGANPYLQVGVTLIASPTAEAGPFEVLLESARAEVCAPTPQ